MPLIADSHLDGFYEYNTDSKDVKIDEFAMDFNYTKCRSLRAPTAEVLLSNLNVSGYVLLACLVVSTLCNLAIFLEEVIFLLKNYTITSRRKKTIWVLAFYPVFSVCALVGCVVPRCSTLVDLIATLYFATCLYNFGRLIINYLGGSKRVWVLVGDDARLVDFRTLPVCCCCFCLPKKPLSKELFARINLQIMQVAIVRPLMHFIAAVLWTNDSYVHGEMQINKAFLYITIINTTSTLVAVYGLMLLRRIFTPELEEKFKIAGKIASIQMCLIASIIPNLVLNSLLVNHKLPCTKILSPKTVAEEILHITWVLTMLPFALLARKFFRRKEDATGYAGNINDDKALDSKQNLVNHANASITTTGTRDRDGV